MRHILMAWHGFMEVFPGRDGTYGLLIHHGVPVNEMLEGTRIIQK